jgi:hypothetical protein
MSCIGENLRVRRTYIGIRQEKISILMQLNFLNGTEMAFFVKYSPYALKFSEDT